MAHPFASTRLALVLIVTASAVLSGCAERIGADPSGPTRAIAYTLDERRRPPFPAGRVEVVVSESPLRRDAAGLAPVVGHVARGETLTVLDAIDRRFRMLGRIVFDGGYWLKVRGPRGDVGWLPAAHVREIGSTAKEAA